ncbi:MAG TPA: hypothetical protein VD993_02190 [Chitinophagaceae bacterium]|nr:hypothetical protein [Chitinophagaceae bacterium]
MAILTFASKGGGGGEKNKNVPAANYFTPIRTANGFTLKSGPVYRGSQLFTQQKKNDVITFTSVITYQRGNTTFILPYKNRVSVPTTKVKNNLNVVDFKINLRK